MNLPKVSICIPAYNQPDFILRALESIAIQVYRDFEVIITDDSNNDQVERVIKRFSSLKIRYYRNEHTLGAPQNWNRAIEKATGEYIKILHHDDWFKSKESLAEFVNAFEGNPDVDFVYSACDAYSETDGFLFTHLSSSVDILKLQSDNEHLFPRNFIGAPSVIMYRSNANIIFDRKLKWVVDIDFYIRLLSVSKRIIYFNKSLVCINADSSFQVTKECMSNPSLQVYEWFYLYSKLNWRTRCNLANIKFLWKLLNKYNILSIDEMSISNTDWKISFWIRVFIYTRILG